MATVYRGRHTTLGREVAIKVLHPHLSRSPRNRTRFAREARAIEHLDHDSILKIFDYSGADAEDCYIVTEFVDGETLQQLVADRGRLPSEVVALIGLRLTSALGYAHALGIIHRDLKPENVMVRRDGQVKLMDFGIARFLDEVHLTVTGALVGSPAYMSPEQAMEQVLDTRSDLFSLGTLLFHLLTGQLPFSGNNPSIILRNIIEGNRPEVMELVPDVSGALADLIEALLQTDPADRPHDCATIQARLAACLAEVEVAADDPAWALEAWLVQPDDYERRLRDHLCAVLLEEGKRRLAAQDHLGALRLCNRLLCMDEDNPQVLDLVESMHAGAAAARRPARRAWLGGGLVAALAAGALAFVLWPKPPAPPPVDAEPVSLQPGGQASLAVQELPESPVESPPATGAAPEARPSPPRSAPARKPAPRRVDPRTAVLAPVASVQIPGTVSVVVQGSWADIWVDGEKVGRTGKTPEIKVQPGKHELVLKNPSAKEVRYTIEIAAGERRIIDVDGLVPLPAVARFDQAMRGDCRITLDSSDRGPVAALAYRLEVAPQVPHTIGIACPETPARAVAVPAMSPDRKFAIEALPAEQAAPTAAAASPGAP